MSFVVNESDTGRFVGTGTSGSMAARLAIARAQHQLSVEAGVHLHTKNFSVINQVGACSLNATLECNQFANAHPHDSHYDQQSFVGLAWRPANEDICCGMRLRTVIELLINQPQHSSPFSNLDNHQIYSTSGVVYKLSVAILHLLLVL